MPAKLGLVLAGGGGKGAYQIGVCKALRRLNLEPLIQVVAGTSIGALNGVMIAQGDLEGAEAIWTSMSMEMLREEDATSMVPPGMLQRLSPQLKEVLSLLPGRSGFTRRGLEKIMDRYVRSERIANSSMAAHATCVTGFPVGTPTYFLLNQLASDRVRKVLSASSSIPFLFDPVEIDGVTYTDGGIGFHADNVPVGPAYQAGCDTIIVVHLDETGIVDESLYPDARILQIVPSQNLGNMLRGNLDFDGTNARHRMAQGYVDAMAQIEVRGDQVVLTHHQAHRLKRMRRGDGGAGKRLALLLATLEEQKARLSTAFPTRSSRSKS